MSVRSEPGCYAVTIPCLFSTVLPMFDLAHCVVDADLCEDKMGTLSIVCLQVIPRDVRPIAVLVFAPCSYGEMQTRLACDF